MFFIIAKIFEFTINPVCWVLILLILITLIKRTTIRRQLFIAAVVIIVIFSDPFLLNQVAKSWDIRQSELHPSAKYSAVIVLGGFSSEMKGKKGYFNFSADRFIEGLKLFEEGKVSHILITGGNGNLLNGGFREADWVKTQLKAFNVPDSCILIEDKSKNTLQNAAYSKIILQKSGLAGPYVLVTSSFHMRRALEIFNKAHIPVLAYPSNFIAGTNDTYISDFVPDGMTFGLWSVYIKEVSGFLVNKLR
jgi:uncharacterized SAM-binding protein YcdF (DUF218 family)